MSSEAAVWAMKWLNFLLLAGLIGKFGRRPFLDLLDGWRRSAADEQDEAAEAARESARKRDTAREQLDGVDKEIERFRREADGRIEDFREKLDEDMEREIRHLEKHARFERAHLEKEARLLVQREFARKSVALCRERIRERITDEEKRRFNRRFIEMLEK
jgi:F-type H+-transporting ATPase subunit b